MTQRKSAQINLSQAWMQVSLKAIAAIGSATGLPWLAGLTALPDALAELRGPPFGAGGQASRLESACAGLLDPKC